MLAKMKMLGLIIAAAVVLTTPVMVYANDGDMDHGSWHHGQKDQMMAKVLNLSDDQVKQLKEAREKQETAGKSLFEQMKSNKEALDAEIVKAAPDMTKVNGIQSQVKALQSQMVDNHLNALLDIKKILAPEQFAGYMALQKAKKLMMHGDHGKMGHKHWGDKEGKEGPSDNK